MFIINSIYEAKHNKYKGQTKQKINNIEKIIIPTKTDNIIVIDLVIKDFVITSNNERYENIKIKRNNQDKLIKLNRQLSKKTNGSKNKNKCRIKLAKFHEKLNNIKENYLHQVSNELLNENQVIVMENLSVNNMMKNHKLAKSLQELSLYKFKSILKYKADWYGKDIIEIDRWYPSSKLCNSCGYKNNELTLNDREWTCPNCNTKHDRDLNAAINIRNEGLRILNSSNDLVLFNDNKNINLNNKINKKKIGSRTTELTLVDNHNIDWMKQEDKCKQG